MHLIDIIEAASADDQTTAIEARARAAGFLDQEGFFAQSADEFLAELG